MERARTISVEAPVLPDVPESIMGALLIAADEVLSDAIRTKWLLPAPAPSWDELQRCRQAFERYPWPAQIGGG